MKNDGIEGDYTQRKEEKRKRRMMETATLASIGGNQLHVWSLHKFPSAMAWCEEMVGGGNLVWVPGCVRLQQAEAPRAE